MTLSEKRKVLARRALQPAMEALRSEFRRGRLTLYLGAGVSRDSGLPNWNTLIASLYYRAVDTDWKPRWIAFPNYLCALGEWLLTKSGEPPEVIAGKIETYYGSNSGFADDLKETPLSTMATNAWSHRGAFCWATSPRQYTTRCGGETLRSHCEQMRFACGGDHQL